MNDIVLKTVEYGDPDGPPLVALHGGWTTEHVWEFIATEGIFHRRWICPGLRGRGGVPKGEPPWTCAQNARDVLATLDSLAAERFDVIGHSAGARDAIELAKLAPTRVRSAVLLDPPLMTQEEFRNNLMPNLSSAGRASGEVETINMEALIPPQAPPNAKPWVERLLMAQYARTESGSYRLRVDWEYWDALIEDIAVTSPSSIGKFPGRVLLIIAGKAGLVTEKGQRALKLELGEQLTSVTLEVGHGIILDAFDETVSLITRFFEEEALSALGHDVIEG